jgi:hypothetical protein
MAKSIAKACLRFTGLFEAELLTELTLRYWGHPCASDPDFRSSLLESAADVLRVSIRGERLFEDIDPHNVNFIAALWYSEQVALQEGGISKSELSERKKWLHQVQKSVPSCFCNPNRL